MESVNIVRTSVDKYCWPNSNHVAQPEISSGSLMSSGSEHWALWKIGAVDCSACEHSGVAGVFLGCGQRWVNV